MKIDVTHVTKVCLIEEIPDTPQEAPWFIWNGKANRKKEEPRIIWEGESKEAGYAWARENNLEIEVIIPLN